MNIDIANRITCKPVNRCHAAVAQAACGQYAMIYFCTAKTLI